MEEESESLKAQNKRARLGRIIKWQGRGPRPALGRWEGLTEWVPLVALGGWSHRNNPRTLLAKKSTVSGHYQFWTRGPCVDAEWTIIKVTGLFSSWTELDQQVLTWPWENNGHSNYWDWILCQHCGMGLLEHIRFDLEEEKRNVTLLPMGWSPTSHPCCNI